MHWLISLSLPSFVKTYFQDNTKGILGPASLKWEQEWGVVGWGGGGVLKLERFHKSIMTVLTQRK